MTCGSVVSWKIPPSSCGVELAPEYVEHIRRRRIRP
jgi:hypothetical protein